MDINDLTGTIIGDLELTGFLPQPITHGGKDGRNSIENKQAG